MSSPYETEHQALDDLRDIYEAARGSRERATMQRLSTQRLTDACAEAGVEFGAYDRSVLSWLAGFESQQAQAVTEVIRRAAKLQLGSYFNGGQRWWPVAAVSRW